MVWAQDDSIPISVLLVEGIPPEEKFPWWLLAGGAIAGVMVMGLD